MASYDIRPLQLHILKILQAVDEVCQEHHLRYYLWAGTMLGAVRHKGFIPWDDDMDICMPRKDYDTLMAHAHEWLPKPFEAVCAETDPNYPGPFGKIQDGSTTLIEREHINYIGGLYIDVFPLDGVCSSKLLQRLNFARYEFWKRVIYYIHRDPFKHGKDLSAVVPLLCQKLFTNRYVQQKLRHIMMRYDYDQCDLIADYDDGKNGIISKAVLGQPTPIKFENIEFMGVEHYDTYLSTKYGDYMTIPKHDEQRQHDFHYLDYQLSYRDYDDKRANMKG